MSMFCAFCGSLHIISRDEIGGITPESVIPFEITKAQLKQAFKKWL